MKPTKILRAKFYSTPQSDDDQDLPPQETFNSNSTQGDSPSKLEFGKTKLSEYKK